jgi:hypothetical protein
MTEQLPTYEQITSWLGDGWTVCKPGFRERMEPKIQSAWPNYPWWLVGLTNSCAYVRRLYLRHDDGTRVDVRAPGAEYPMPESYWETWFGRISGRARHGSETYDSHVTWHEAEPKQRVVIPGKVETIFSQRLNFDNAIAMAAGGNDGPNTVRVDSLKPGDWFRRDDGTEWQWSPTIIGCVPGLNRHTLVTPIAESSWVPKAPNPPNGTPEATGAQNGQEVGTEAGETVSNNRPPGQGELLHAAIWQSFEDAVDHANQEMRKVLFDKGWLSNHADELAKAVTEKRWPNVPATDIPRLERLLAEQVAHGGQDGGAARHMLVLRERLRAQNDAEEAARSESLKRSRAGYEAKEKRLDRRYGLVALMPSPGIADLRLERPLICYKRGGR